MTTERNLTLERDQEVIPLARKLLQALAKHDDLLMGSSETITADTAAAYYQKVYQEDLVPLLLESNIKLNAIPYLFSIILQPFQLLNDVATSSFEMNRDLADGFMWGVTDIQELRVSDLDRKLQAFAVALREKAAAKIAEAQVPVAKKKGKK